MAVRIGAGGRLVVPGEFRAALGIEPGDTVILVMEHDGLRMLTPDQAVRRAQALVARHVDRDRGLVDELLAERREDIDAP
jgi:AbrB family looped-hinge helix DNA binding protein